MMVPFIEIPDYRKMWNILIPYLESEFGCFFFFLAYRRILPVEKLCRGLFKQKRPRSRTLVCLPCTGVEVSSGMPGDLVTVYSFSLALPPHSASQGWCKAP